MTGTGSPTCSSCHIREVAFPGARCKRCREGKAPTSSKLRDAGRVGTPSAATIGRKSRYRNAPKRGWS